MDLLENREDESQDEETQNYICVVAKVADSSKPPSLMIMVYEPAFSKTGEPSPNLVWVFQMTFAQAGILARMTKNSYGNYSGLLLQAAGNDYALVVGFCKISMYLDPEQMIALSDILLEFIQRETIKLEYEAHTRKLCGPDCKFCSMMTDNQLIQ